jgi:hypothetical protein
MAFAIIRAAKIKTFQGAGALHSHVVRKEIDKEGEIITRENVDVSRTKDNTHWQVIGEDIVSGIKGRMEELDIKPRKNAVLAIEYLVSASPEFFDESKNNYSTDSYFTEALKFIREKHGTENVVSFTIHRDEMTPHAHIVAVPVDKQGKLNCREFLGGREKLSQLQDDFHAAMKHTSRGVPLHRGEKKGRNEPEKYIERTSPKIASLRYDLKNTANDIGLLQKSCEEALKSLDMERLRLESEKLQKEMVRLSLLENQRNEAEKQLKKDPRKQTGLGM